MKNFFRFLVDISEVLVVPIGIAVWYFSESFWWGVIASLGSIFLLMILSPDLESSNSKSSQSKSNSNQKTATLQYRKSYPEVISIATQRKAIQNYRAHTKRVIEERPDLQVDYSDKNELLRQFDSILDLSSAVLAVSLLNKHGAFYYGEIDREGNAHGLGLYHSDWYESQDGDINFHFIEIRRWNHGQPESGYLYRLSNEEAFCIFKTPNQHFEIIKSRAVGTFPLYKVSTLSHIYLQVIER